MAGSRWDFRQGDDEAAARALDSPATRNTPPTPNHATPMSTPASAGAITRIASCEI